MAFNEGLRYDTVLLDFHGTFTSNRGRLARALNTAYVSVVGRSITAEEFRIVFNRDEGVSVQDKLKEMINSDLTPEDKQVLVDRYQRESNAVYVPKHRHLIPELAELGALLAIVTNGNEQVVRDTMEKWDLTRYVAGIYGKGHGAALQGLRRKPHPMVIDHVIQDLRTKHADRTIRRNKTLMVGDYQDDIGAGNNAGIHTAFLVTGPNQRPEYYNARPTYALLDAPSLTVASEWLQGENTYMIRNLPKLVSGEL